LNEDLAEAAAMGHDIGHAPFGHSGERTLNKLCPLGFQHQDQSLRVVDVLADGGRGLNLTLAVRDGILKHSKGQGPIFVKGKEAPQTLEGQVVRVSDLLAYLAHDMDDALEANIMSQDDIPMNLMLVFGETSESRKNAMVADLLQNTRVQGQDLCLGFSPQMEEDMRALRAFMFERVYCASKVVEAMEDGAKIIQKIYQTLCVSEELYKALPLRYKASCRHEALRDFISGMTDRFAINYARDL
jgi:dGTPase